MRISLFALTALVLATSTTPSLYSQAKLKPQNTVIHETSFRLTLPGPWMTGDTKDPSLRTYHTSSGKEGVTVSIFGSFFGSPGSKSHEERSAIFKRWVEKRRQAETKMPGFDAVSLTEPTYAEVRETMGTRYEGFDPPRNRRFHCLILASSSAFEVFYYEALDMTARAAEDRARMMFNSADIPK